MWALLDMLRECRFFSEPESTGVELEPTSALVVVRVGDLDRTVLFGKGEEGRTERRDRVVGHIHALTDEFAWQHWWDLRSQPSWKLFYASQAKWFSQHTDAAERAGRLRGMVASTLSTLISVEDRLAAARFARTLPGGGGALEEQHVAAFVKAVAVEREANEFVAEVVDLLVPDAGPQAASALVDAVAQMIGPSAHALLVHLCGTLPSATIAGFAEDERWKVRRAAVAALAGKIGTEARPVLVRRLEDDEMLVCVAAAEALASLKDAAVLPTLAKLRDEHSPALRESVAYAYGLLGGAKGLEGARDMLLGDRNPSVRVRAIRGLVDGRDPRAADLLVDVFAKETEVPVRAAAAAAIIDLESPELVRRLIERLELTDSLSPERVALVNVLSRFQSVQPLEILRRVLQGDDQPSADAAALGLARRWEDAALIQLIRMLRRGDNARAAVRRLQILTSQAFASESWKRQAENYAGWAATNAVGNPRKWFVKALTDRAYETIEFQPWVAASGPDIPPASDGMVPILLRALRDADWFIQRNASFLLSRRMGAGAPPVISFQTSREEAEAAIRAYHDWWAQRRAELEAREQG
jgi:HEAT repeat protein